jgi:hypothetical protein
MNGQELRRSLYGTTSLPSAGKSGKMFKITPGGTVTVLYGFANITDGFPWAPPFQAADGTGYGVIRGTTPVAHTIKMPAAGA